MMPTQDGGRCALEGEGGGVEELVTATTAATPGLPRAREPLMLVLVSVQEMAIAVHWSEVGGFEVRVEKESLPPASETAARIKLDSPRQQNCQGQHHQGNRMIHRLSSRLVSPRHEARQKGCYKHSSADVIMYWPRLCLGRATPLRSCMGDLRTSTEAVSRHKERGIRISTHRMEGRMRQTRQQAKVREP